MKKLLKVLRGIGQPVQVYQAPDGSRVLLLAHGGRVLGLFGPQSEENFYWTNPGLAETKAARGFFAQEAWHNSGGDRSWLAPEVDLFLPRFPRLDAYWQQRSLDPGRYRFRNAAGRIALENRLRVRLSRSRREVSLRLAKSFAPAPNPLRHERDFDPSRIEFAGYAQHTSLELMGSSRSGPARVGLWNLIQMPPGGELLIPTYSRNEPLRVFDSVGRIPPGDLRVDEHLVCYRMRQEGEHKISLRAASACGRAGYLLQDGVHWSLVIRNFSVNPSGEYVDSPWTDPDRLGFAVQACSVKSGLGSFAELEYHAPAIGRRTGQTGCTDATQVWAFRGPKAAIHAVARRLLTGLDWRKRR
jgi:hypothetical protein